LPRFGKGQRFRYAWSVWPCVTCSAAPSPLAHTLCRGQLICQDSGAASKAFTTTTLTRAPDASECLMFNDTYSVSALVDIKNKVDSAPQGSDTATAVIKCPQAVVLSNSLSYDITYNWLW
jgi:hypothetical protein